MMSIVVLQSGKDIADVYLLVSFISSNVTYGARCMCKQYAADLI